MSTTVRDKPPTEKADLRVSVSSFQVSDGCHVLVLCQHVNAGQTRSQQPLAMHFCLDNSSSMGSSSQRAQICFSELISLANLPCSFTVFGSDATRLSSSITSPGQMRDIKLPSQSMTNIGGGLRLMMGAAMSMYKTDPHAHNILVFLSDGHNNCGTHPKVVIKELQDEMRKKTPGIRVSFLVVGVSSNSNTSFGMQAKVALETVPLEGMLPIYFCSDAREMQGVLDELVAGLHLNSGGGVTRIAVPETSSAGLVVGLGEPSAASTECYLRAERPTVLFLEGERPEEVLIDGVAVPVEPAVFSHTLVTDAIMGHIGQVRIRKVSGNDVQAQVDALEPWLNGLEECIAAERAWLTSNQTGIVFHNMGPADRIRAAKATATALLSVRELRHEAAHAAAHSANTSAAQAAFLTGASGKFAGKALVRAAMVGGDCIKEVADNLRQIAARMPLALRKDVLNLVRRVSPSVLAAAAAARATRPQSKPVPMALLETVMHRPESIDLQAPGPEMGEFLDHTLFSLVEECVEDIPTSYLSLFAQWQQLQEWVTCVHADLPLEEYQVLMFVGMLGHPITVRRCDATQMDPFQCSITQVLPSPIDTPSLYCALHANQRIASPEGPDVQDVLMLIDPSCPNASALAYWSKLVEHAVSVTLTRDLYMYLGTSCRLALHAHALLAVLDVADLTEASVTLAVKILYSARRVMGPAASSLDGTYPALVRGLLDWGELTEAEGVAHPVQLLLGLCALDLDALGLPPMTDPALLNLFNEIMSRGARGALRGAVGTADAIPTRDEGYRVAARLLGIGPADPHVPQVSELGELDPRIEEVEATCSRAFEVSPAAVSEACAFAVRALRGPARVVRFAGALRAYLKQHGGWETQMEMLEIGREGHMVQALLDASRQAVVAPEVAGALECVGPDVDQRAASLVLSMVPTSQPDTLLRTVVAMAVQAHVLHTSALRTGTVLDLDVRDASALATVAVQLRMRAYKAALALKHRQWETEGRSIILSRCATATPSQFRSMFDNPHSLSRVDFWALCDAARGTENQEVFVAACNQAFRHGRRFRNGKSRKPRQR